LTQVYPSSVYVGGFSNISVAQTLHVGTVIADLSMMAPGDYRLIVSSILDDSRSGLADSNGDIEPLSGFGRIVPEPGSALILLAGVSLICGFPRRPITLMWRSERKSRFEPGRE